MDLFVKATKLQIEQQTNDGCVNNDKTVVNCLLTIPKSDFDNKDVSTTQKSADRKNVDEDQNLQHLQLPPSLLLLQLPCGWSISDLTDSYFTAPCKSRNKDDNKNSGRNDNNSKSAATLVVEGKNTSFSVYRVETSNALVVVPPPQPLPQQFSTGCSEENDENLENNRNHVNVDSNDDTVMNDVDSTRGDVVMNDDIADSNNSKERKRKITITSASFTNNRNGNTATAMPTLSSRLIHKTSQTSNGTGGDTGASFLQLRPKSVSLNELEELLTVWNPYYDTNSNCFDEDNNNRNNSNDRGSLVHGGKTIRELAISLQVATYQIKTGLQALRAFPLPTTNLPMGTNPFVEEYVLLSEEVWNVCNEAIISTLTEQYEYTDTYCINKNTTVCTDNAANYSRVKGIPLRAFTNHVLSRMSANERIPFMESVVQFCIRQLMSTTTPSAKEHNENENRHDDDNDDNEWIHLCIQKVAVCVAKRLFYKQSKPWEESVFMERWQSELPGIHNKVDTTMLRGVAIRVLDDDSDNERDGTTTGSTNRYYWKYFPKESLPRNDVTKYITRLFHEKEIWAFDEIQPYLEYLLFVGGSGGGDRNDAKSTPSSSTSAQETLLLRYAKQIIITTNDPKAAKSLTTNNDNGIPIKFYQKK